MPSGDLNGHAKEKKTKLQSDTTTPDPAANAFLASTMRYIEFQKQKGGAVGEKYEAIKVSHAG